MLPAWSDAAGRIIREGNRRVLVLGAVDVGRSTFCGELLRAADWSSASLLRRAVISVSVLWLGGYRHRDVSLPYSYRPRRGRSRPLGSITVDDTLSDSPLAASLSEGWLWSQGRPCLEHLEPGPGANL
jgi:hypothetical protein